MITPGLCSVTFRSLTPRQIIDLAVESGLGAIEWGGDIHVPPDQPELAREIGRMTRSSGLQVAAYGSYYRTGQPDQEADFAVILKAAGRLGAPVIRVWAGRCGSTLTSEADRQKIIKDARRVTEMAAAEDIRLAFEFHENTLTDQAWSAVQLLQAVGHAYVRSYWQPLDSLSASEKVYSLRQVLPWLENIHLHHRESGQYQPFEQGLDAMRDYLQIAAGLDGDRYALLEFVRGDDPGQLLRDARALIGVLQAVQP